VANTRSALKRDRQSKKRRARNVTAKSEIKTLVKKCRQAIEAGNEAEAREAARMVESRLDRAAKKGIVHQNNANRRSARLQRAVSGAFKPAEA